MQMDYSDEDLMLMYRDGDASAFEMLYSRHKGPVYRYILRHCRNSTIAEELFQDVWLKLIHARERYQVSAKFTTYLYRITHNHVIDYFRKYQSGDQDGVVMQEDTLAAPYSDQPERRTELGQQERMLLDAIETLPYEQRRVFLLKEEAGMSLHDIADTLGVNVHFFNTQ